MSFLPEGVPQEPENSINHDPAETPFPEPASPTPWAAESAEPESHENSSPTADALFGESADEPQMFVSYSRPDYFPPQRIPHLGHLALLALLVGFGWLGSGGFLMTALHFHFLGISTFKQAVADYRYNLAIQGVEYFLALGGCLLVFPLVWRTGFFEGIHWRGATALRLRGRLISLALGCFVLAMLNGLLMPGPTDAPIDKIFRVPGAAWLLFAFGITLAPFFEEIGFRGFLLPALCTVYDWVTERAAHAPPRPLDENGHPQWSLPAMVVASVLTSIPFAWVHGEQTGYSLGPFLLLVCVSLILCWARLSARSLAASVTVHACYNFMLFSLMLFGTDGFKHLDNM